MEALFRQQFRRDLRALSDINMPSMSGLEMLPVREKRPGLPVILITAYGGAETRRRRSSAAQSA